MSVQLAEASEASRVLGDRVRDFMDARKWTVTDLAQRMHIRQRAVRKLLRGTLVVTAAHSTRLGEVFGTTAHEWTLAHGMNGAATAVPAPPVIASEKKRPYRWRPPYSDNTRRDALEAITNGYTVLEVHDTLGISTARLYKWMKKHNVKAPAQQRGIKPRRYFSPEVRASVVARLKNGEKGADLAAEYHVRHSRISAWKRWHKDYTPHDTQVLSHEQMQLLRERIRTSLRERHMSPEIFARRCALTPELMDRMVLESAFRVRFGTARKVAHLCDLTDIIGETPPTSSIEQAPRQAQGKRVPVTTAVVSPMVTPSAVLHGAPWWWQRWRQRWQAWRLVHRF